MGNRAKELTAGERVDLDGVPSGYRRSVASSCQRRQCRGVAPLDGGHARQLRDQLITLGVPDMGAMVSAAECNEALIGHETGCCIALRANLRRPPTAIRRGSFPYPGSAVP